MARDPAGTYSYPAGTEGHPDATIESGDYNAFILDVQADLNFPRPISSGGTNATTAQGALANLGGELAAQVVTNYNSFPFSSGSFYSMAGATGEPVTGHNFIGICYVGVDANNMVLQARDESDTQVPGRLYVREKKAGTWSAWKIDNRTTIDNGGGDVINGISGDTADMFFGLRGTAPSSYFTVNTKADVTGTNAIRVNKDGSVIFAGAVTIPAGSPTDPNALTSKTYVDAGDAAANANANTRVLKAGDTITGNLTVNGGTFTPTVAAGAAGTEVVTAAWVRNYGQARDAQLFAGIPSFNANGYTTVGTDSQKCVWGTGTTTINSAAHPAGACITFIAWGGNMVIANTANMYSNINQTFASGTRTLLQGGIATALQFTGGYWVISGNGLQ